MSRNRRKKIAVLVRARTEFAGVGTRKAKLVLNKAAKADSYARALRVALEAEDSNLTAKRYFGGDCGGYSYAEVNYFKKAAQIEALIGISKSEGWTFGVQPSDVRDTTHIIYFDLPGVGQLSWHYSPREPLPVYDGKWDGKSGSTLPKLEAAIAELLKRAVAA
jgi:hypothetical protein